MKRMKVLLTALLCACFAAALVACQSPTVSRSSESIEVKAEESSKSEEVGQVPTEPFWVLVNGLDTRLGTVEIKKENYADGKARTDTMMLVRVDPVNYKLAVITIPRDTAAEVNGATHKINQAYELSGINETLSQVQALTGVAPNYYMNMTFVQFEDFINGLGGIKGYVPVDMGLKDIVTGDWVWLNAGEQKLNGAEALVLARVRKQYTHDQDAVRQVNDRALLMEAISMVAYNPDTIDSAVETFLANSETNFKPADLKATVKAFAANADKLSFVSGTGPYTGSEVDGQWLATRDEAKWHEIIDLVNNGGDPQTIFPDVTP